VLPAVIALTPPVVASEIELKVRGLALTVSTAPGEVVIPPVTVAVMVAEPTAAPVAKPELDTVALPLLLAQLVTALP
jgi:hypothetical protein